MNAAVNNIALPRSMNPAMIEDLIHSVSYYQFPETTVTVCCMTLANGYNTVGESACIDPVNFDAELGRTIARKNAFEKIWALEGYALRQRLVDAGELEGAM
jgi:hypothetical protein